MDFTTVLGLLAGACTTGAFIPQVIKTWRTKRADDLSLGMYVVITVGIFAWLAYGLILHDIPIIAANVTGVVLVSSILVMKLRFG